MLMLFQLIYTVEHSKATLNYFLAFHSRLVEQKYWNSMLVLILGTWSRLEPVNLSGLEGWYNNNNNKFSVYVGTKPLSDL